MEKTIAFSIFIASLVIFALCAVAGWIHDNFGDL
jgi:hypothetical protein